MNFGEFSTQVNRVEELLKVEGLIFETNSFPNYSKVRKGDYKNIPYVDLWKKFYIKRLFNFRLQDHSLIQMQREENSSVFSAVSGASGYQVCLVE